MPPPRDLNPGASPAHFFGAEVRRAREAAGMTLADLGARVPCDVSTVSRVESGLLAPTERFASTCDEAFPEMRGWFTRFYNSSRRWESCPTWFRDWLDIESKATSLRLFEHTLIPGLLQTEDYARSVLQAHPHTSTDVVEKRVAGRMARQEILDREDPPAPVLWVLLDENVLGREVGGTKVMHDQLVHLLKMAQRPNITVQVIPATIVHPGLHGAFAIAEVPGTPSAVYLETARGGRSLEDTGGDTMIPVLFDALRTEALTGRASMILIERAEERWTQQ